MKKIIILILSIILIGGGFAYYKYSFKKEVNKDAIKFSKEYNSVNENNVFVYKTSKEIIKILENGTGIVYLGFPECPWCTEYIKYLNETAIKNNVDKIYYLNILNDRKNNTVDYLKIVSLLNNYLQFDDEGNKRIYVPAVIAIKEGKIVGFDDETAYDTKGYKTPSEYWEKEDLNALKNKLTKMFNDTKTTYCTSNCNK